MSFGNHVQIGIIDIKIFVIGLLRGAREGRARSPSSHLELRRDEGVGVG